MDILTAMKERHSVRSYTGKAIELEKAERLKNLAEEINEKTGLHIQVITDEPDGFSGMLAKYGSFGGVKNYIVMAGKNGKDREIGYYGEKMVLEAQMLGLNTCWVALTFNKSRAHYELNEGEKLYVVISLGYGADGGKARKSKSAEEVSDVTAASPEWYKRGVEAALLAPTAINQQKFSFALNGDKVTAKAGMGFYTEMDLGIAEYHFDIASERENFGLSK